MLVCGRAAGMGLRPHRAVHALPHTGPTPRSIRRRRQRLTLQRRGRSGALVAARRQRAPLLGPAAQPGLDDDLSACRSCRRPAAPSATFGVTCRADAAQTDAIESPAVGRRRAAGRLSGRPATLGGLSPVQQGIARGRHVGPRQRPNGSHRSPTRLPAAPRSSRRASSAGSTPPTWSTSASSSASQAICIDLPRRHPADRSGRHGPRPGRARSGCRSQFRARRRPRASPSSPDGRIAPLHPGRRHPGLSLRCSRAASRRSRSRLRCGGRGAGRARGRRIVSPPWSADGWRSW